MSNRMLNRLQTTVVIAAAFCAAPVIALAATRAQQQGAQAAQQAQLLQDTPAQLEQGFPSWITGETSVAFTKLLANISPSDVAIGEVIASPQRANPNYYYHWVRDAALTMDVIVRDYILTDVSSRGSLQTMITNYLSFSRSNQLSTTAITGLGEPKFNPDGSAFSGDWGRPQNDGPALRAMTSMRFARELIAQGQTKYVQTQLYDGKLPSNTLIKTDLEYVARHWTDQTFDLWEEVKGDHFYTRIVQASALFQGSDFASSLGDSAAATFYSQQAKAIMASLDNFWDAQAGFIRATINRVRGGETKQGLDSAIILGVLHAHLQEGPYTVIDSRVMATALSLESSFGSIYAVNDLAHFANFGTAIGRYPEDIYSGTANLLQGNPWVLSTAALAQYDYELAATLSQMSQFTVDGTNAAFLHRISATIAGATVQQGLTITSSSGGIKQLVDALIARGDMFLERIRLHQNVDGSLSEQIDRNTGYMSSARDLTWNYASFITAQWARQAVANQ